jgi:succinate-acetate transporter protein
MPFQHLKENAEDIQDNLKNVIDSNIAYYKLWLFKVLMKSTTLLLKVVLMVLLFTLFLLFASVALALYLGELLQSNALGFLSVGGMYIVLLVFVCLLKDKIVEGSVLEKFSKVFFNE